MAAAAVVAATVFGILALQNKASYDKTPTYANTDDGNNFASYSDGCIALAAAAGITSLVLYLTSPTPPAGAPVATPARLPVLSPSPLLLPHAGGAAAFLRF